VQTEPNVKDGEREQKEFSISLAKIQIKKSKDKKSEGKNFGHLVEIMKLQTTVQCV
jgi:hypothetical protein